MNNYFDITKIAQNVNEPAAPAPVPQPAAQPEPIAQPEAVAPVEQNPVQPPVVQPPAQPPAARPQRGGNRPLLFVKEAPFGNWMSIVIQAPSMTKEEFASLQSLAKVYIQSTKKPNGTYPTWATWVNKAKKGALQIADFKLFSKTKDMEGPFFNIGTTEAPFFTQILDKLSEMGFDTAQIQRYEKQNNPAAPVEQQQQQPVEQKNKVQVSKPEGWQTLILKFERNNDIRDFIVKNKIGGRWDPAYVAWRFDLRSDPPILPSRLESMSEFMRQKGFDTTELDAAIKEYKDELEKNKENLKDPLKTLVVYDATRNTKFLVAINFPRTPQLIQEMEDYVKFSFPSKGDLTDLRLDPAPENYHAKVPKQLPNGRWEPSGMRLDQQNKWYVYGSFDDFFRFGALIKSRGWDVTNLRAVLSGLLRSKALERTRYSGELDGYEVKDENGRQLRDAKGNPQFDYERFYKDVEEITGDRAKLFDKQKDGVRWLYERGNAILGDKTGTGKCTKFNTLLFANGQLVTMEEIWNKYSSSNSISLGENEEWCEPCQNLIINTFDGERISTTKVNGLFRQKFKGNLRKIKTWNGKTISTTYEHKFLTPTGWTSDIKVGDCIMSPVFLPIQSAEFTDCSDELAEFLGWQISEGCEIKNTTAITQKDTVILENLQKVFRKIAFDNNILNEKTNQIYESKIKHSKTRSSNLIISSKNYIKFLESKGYVFGLKSKDKQIPTYILHAKDSAVKAFLRAYFSAEAYCDTKTRRIDLTSASKKLIHQLSYMLSRFGIQHSFGESTKCAVNGKKIKRLYYRLYITGSGVEAFIKDIGFCYNYKNEAFLNQNSKTNPNKEGKPLNHILKPFFEKNNIPPLHANIRDWKYVTGEKWASNEEIEKFITGFRSILNGESLEKYQQLKKSKWTNRTTLAYQSVQELEIEKTIQSLESIKNSELQYERVVSVENEEYDNYVYDLTVFGKENYIAEGLVCHNTLTTLVAAAMRLKQSGGRCLIITLKSTQIQWANEIQNKLGEDAANISFNPGDNKKWTIITYPNISAAPEKNNAGVILQPNGSPVLKPRWRSKQQIIDGIFNTQFTALILDEAHLIKNETSGASQIMALIAPKIPFKWGASATSAANTAIDVHNILSIVGHTLGEISTRDFNKEFVGRKSTIKDFGDPVKAREILALQEEKAYNLRKWLTLSGAYLSRSQKAINPNLPDHIIDEQYISEEDFDMRAFARDFENIKLQYGGNAGAALAVLTKQRVLLAQMKVPHTMALAKEILDRGEKVLVFSNFRTCCQSLYAGLDAHLKAQDPDFEVVRIMGDDNGAAIMNAVAQFKDPENPARAMVIAAKKGGTGVSLENSTQNVIMNDFDWSPYIAEQTEGRAFRITNVMPVNTKYMVVKGPDGRLSPDEVFYKFVRSKIKIAQIIQNLDSEAEEYILNGLNDAKIQAEIAKARAADMEADVQLGKDLNEMFAENGIEFGGKDNDFGQIAIDFNDAVLEREVEGNDDEENPRQASTWYDRTILAGSV